MNVMNLPDDYLSFYPESFLNDKFLVVPTMVFPDGFLHAGFYHCKNVNENAPGMESCFREVFNDYYGDQLLFEKVSVNDLTSNEMYCKKCVSLVDSFFINEDTFEPGVTLGKVLVSLDVIFRRLKKVTDFSFAFDSSISYSNNSYYFFNDVTSLNNVMIMLRDRFFLDRAGSVDKLRLEVIDYLSNVFVTDGFEESVLFKELTNDGFNFTCFESSSFNVLETFEGFDKFVVFDSNVLNSLYNMSFKNNYDSSLQSLFEKLFFYPGFKPGMFSVLPYFEFQALQHIVSFMSSYDWKVKSYSFPNKVTVTKSDISDETLDMMQALFDASNDTLNNYETLYSVVKTV